MNNISESSLFRSMIFLLFLSISNSLSLSRAFADTALRGHTWQSARTGTAASLPAGRTQ